MPVVVTLGVATADEAVVLAQGLRPAARQAGLQLSVRADGTARARLSGGRYGGMPLLRGRVQVRDGAAVLDGAVHEAVSERVWPALFAAVSVLMAVVGVLQLAGNGFDAVPLAICAVSAVGFGLLARALGRLRRDGFDARVQELRRRLEALLGTAGDAG